MTYTIHGPERWPNDPRDEYPEPEIETAFCSYCGAEVPTDEIVIVFQSDKCCNECLPETKAWADDNGYNINKKINFKNRK